MNSVLGGVLIVVGLYMVLWGKGREAAKVGELPQEEATVVEVVIDSPANNIAAAVAQHQQEEKL